MTSNTHAVDIPETLLQAEGLRVTASGAWPALRVDFQVRAGEFHLIHSRNKTQSMDFADGLLGLQNTLYGLHDLNRDDDAKVSYLDHDWQSLTPEAALRQRRNIGRVQSQGNWMETRSVMENLLLPMMHHSILPDTTLRDNAADLALRFGLPGLPTHLPNECPARDLERAACIRAFLGRPRLVILEHPMEFEDAGLLPPLIDAIQQVRRRQGAVVWFTEHQNFMADPSIPADYRYRIVGSHLHSLEQPA